MSENEQAEIQQAAREYFDKYVADGTDHRYPFEVLAGFHISQSEEERKRIQELEEWKKSVSSAIKTIPEFHSGQWGGDKEGWGFHLEVVNWLRRTKEADEAEVSRLRAAQPAQEVEPSTPAKGPVFWEGTRIPASVRLVGNRTPTEEEIKMGMELAPMADECLSRNKERGAASGQAGAGPSVRDAFKRFLDYTKENLIDVCGPLSHCTHDDCAENRYEVKRAEEAIAFPVSAPASQPSTKEVMTTDATHIANQSDKWSTAAIGAVSHAVSGAASQPSALLNLKCTSCGHKVHPSTGTEYGCKELRLGEQCRCERATILGDDILALSAPKAPVEQPEESNLQFRQRNSWAAEAAKRIHGPRDWGYQDEAFYMYAVFFSEADVENIILDSFKCAQREAPAPAPLDLEKVAKEIETIWTSDRGNRDYRKRMTMKALASHLGSRDAAK